MAILHSRHKDAILMWSLSGVAIECMCSLRTMLVQIREIPILLKYPSQDLFPVLLSRRNLKTSCFLRSKFCRSVQSTEWRVELHSAELRPEKGAPSPVHHSRVGGIAALLEKMSALRPQGS